MVGAVPSGPVERLSTNDLTVLATDRGSVPMNIAAALVLDRAGDLSLAELGTLLDLRLSAVPRLRQRLSVTPVGCGRPVWVDDASFSLQRHLSGRSVSTETELLEVVADLGSTRLDPQLPLWRAVLVQGLPGDRSALVLVLHHVLADGLGGLAVLAALTDGAPGTDRSSSQPSGAFPRPAPDLRDLALDSARAHVAGLRGLPAALARGLRGLQELGLGNRPRLAVRTSLNQPTGGRRRLSLAAVPLADVAAAAHRAGGTVNDVVLAAVVGALSDTLAARGEHPEQIVVSVPVAARRGADTAHLGNEVGVRPVAVPTLAHHHERLAAVIGLTHAARPATRAASAAPLGLAFRTLARAKLFQFFIERQRLVHTFETNLRGPRDALHLGGHRISGIVPAVVSPGNVGVSFTVLSYAGELTVTVVADPDLLPEQDRLTHSLASLWTPCAAASWGDGARLPRRPGREFGALPDRECRRRSPRGSCCPSVGLCLLLELQQVVEAGSGGNLTAARWW